MSNGRDSGNSVRAGRGPKQDGKYPKQRSNNFPQFQFVRCELSGEQKETLVQSIHSGVIVAEQCYDLVSEGYKLSLTRDDKNKCFIATITDNREGSETRYYALSARGSTLTIAMCALSFKHNIIFSEGWDMNQQQPTADEWGIG